MTSRRALLAAMGALPLVPCSASVLRQQPSERSEWSNFFSDVDAVGSILIFDEREGDSAYVGHNIARALTRFTPASTYKIPHSLFALDAGLVKDEFEVIPWDAVRRPPVAWNADQTLRSSVANSVVWVFEGFAQTLGPQRERKYMRAVEYGNALTTGEAPFWVEGDLAISCEEQISFLRKLYRNELPFRTEHQRLVKDVILVEATRDWRLRAKTGWSGKVGRWVGWVESQSGAVFFALNIDTPMRTEDLWKREAITRSVLRAIKALPAV